MKKTLIIFVILSVAASAINYLAYPLLGRILPASQYIDITVSLSFLTQITTFLSSIIAITIGLTKDGTGNGKKTIEALQSVLFKLFLVLIVIIAALSPFIFKAISVPVLFLIPIIFMMLVSLPITIVSGYLNGKQLLIKLGFVAVISAGLQLTLGLVSAQIFQSGIVTVSSMAIAQILAITVIYYIFRKESLPSPLGIFSLKQTDVLKQPAFKKLVYYTAFASCAIMLVSLTQVLDLVVINAQTEGGSKFYTDIYIISRIVFFAGMIFIWPFLGSIDLENSKNNIKPALKLLGLFLLIAVGMIVGLFLFGSLIIYLLLGVTYAQDMIFTIGTLSIIFKFLLLVVTAITLYYMVLRSPVAIVYSVLISSALFAYAALHGKDFSTQEILIHMVTIAGIGAIVGIGILIRHISLKSRD